MSSHRAAAAALAEFDRAEEAYTHIRRRDPYRLDGMDTYSNILYVKEAKEELGFLAHTAVQIDKYRPETCCIIGNYYSLRNEHEAAVTYFRRALAVNRKFLSAWTLMGHEYVEMKNTGAAIEAYRRAVDINPRDYRAWYGLGQTYEILRMFFYALHYYQKATALRPYDSRMWCAIAGCYEEMDRPQDAVKCYERAVGLNDREGIARLKLATLYTQSGDADNAYKFYSEHVEQQDRNGVRRHPRLRRCCCTDAMLLLCAVPRCLSLAAICARRALHRRVCIYVLSLRRAPYLLRRVPSRRRPATRARPRRCCTWRGTPRTTACLTWPRATRRGCSPCPTGCRRRRPWCARSAA